ncbi:phage tail protein [Amycolatopsis sp. NPDC049688]|uniref:phage tail protein n=1 Tax=Amycolatopsis sp. NPDC049688 TaxID=3154733 RepID=UPI00343A0B0B
MSCGPAPATFRLLDFLTGWDEAGVDGVVGLADPAGLRLAHAGVSPDGPTRAQLLPWFPDPRLAPGCRPGGWYLVDGDLLRREACGGAFRLEDRLRAPVSVAARGHRVAVVDSDRVLVWRREGEQLAGVIRVPGARLAALGPGDEVLVTREGRTDLWRFSSDGHPRGVLRTGVDGVVIGLRSGPGGSLWLLTDDLTIHRRDRRGPFRTSTMDELREVPSSTLFAVDEEGFCLREQDCDGEVVSCYDWHGEPQPARAVAGGPFVTAGTLTTSLIDSGISRCRWHRVRVEAVLPAGTAVAVQLVMSEDEHYTGADWQTAPAGVTDFLVDQPPGRHLTLRLRLSGDGTATPVVHRVRLDFPRSTSADLLPPAFRQDPVADDFTERFLALFDATLAELDEVIERYPALLDPAGVPDRVLPWLAGLLGLSFEAGWDAPARRALLAAAPELYRRRGTPWAVGKAVELVTGVTPVIDELPAERNWARVGGGSGLGSVRLAGRSSARFRIGASALGSAPLRAFGDPADDPLTAHAHRYRLLLPAGAADEDAVRRLAARQAPAHTAGSVRSGRRGFVVGTRSRVGVDSAFVPAPRAVLGRVRLNQGGVLRPGPRGPRDGVGVGVVSAVGVHTQMS